MDFPYIDSKTKYMWSKKISGKTYSAAVNYCNDLDENGYSDWHLPNKNELASLLNYDKSSAPYSDFPNMPSSYFWSSSTFVNTTDSAWYLGFGSGHVGIDNKPNSRAVRCVR